MTNRVAKSTFESLKKSHCYYFLLINVEYNENRRIVLIKILLDPYTKFFSFI